MAGQFVWAYDAPTGVYKNHALSAQLFKAAIHDTKVMQFVEPMDAFGRGMGESITYPRVSNLTVPTSAVLDENKEIPEDTMSLGTGSITVYELGRRLVFTGLSKELSKIELPKVVEDLLKDQMSLYLDKMAMDSAFKAAKICYIPTSATAGTWDTDGTPSTAALVNVGYYHVEAIRDYLYSTIGIKPYSGDDYVGLASTKFLRGIKDDPKFEVWNKYTTPEAKANGEVGKIEGIRFIEIGNTDVLSATKGTGSVLGEAVIFGARPALMATAVPPHLRYDIPSDSGRIHKVAWYGVLNFGPVWNTANAGEANIIRVTSS